MNLDSHASVNELLPWYAKGTISEADRALVERHLRDCADCREEVAFLQEVDAVASDVKAATPDLQAALGKTLARIDEWERTRTPTVMERVKAFLAAGWSPQPTLARALVLSQLAVIVALVGTLIVARQPQPTSGTLSGGVPNTKGALLTVVFQPATTEETLRRTLLDLDARVVSGPSTRGVYIVELPQAPTDTTGVDVAIERLRANAAVIRFAERQP